MILTVPSSQLLWSVSWSSTTSQIMWGHVTSLPTHISEIQGGHLNAYSVITWECRHRHTWNSMERWRVDKERHIWVPDCRSGSSSLKPYCTECRPESRLFWFLLMLQDLPKPIRANFILDVETDELSITAGLQDRVVQVSLMTHGAWTCLLVLTMKWQALLLCLAGVWRLSVHGF